MKEKHYYEDDKHGDCSVRVQTYKPIIGSYVGKDNDATETIVNNSARTIEIKLKSHNYASKYEFPNQGNEAVIYIDITENKSYRWSKAELKYYCVGSDYDDVKIINGGNAQMCNDTNKKV